VPCRASQGGREDAVPFVQAPENHAPVAFQVIVLAVRGLPPILSIYFKDAIDTAIMEIAALLLPAVTLTLLAVMGFIIVFGFAVFANEKRYLAIIDALIKDKKQP
jgi:hypothetical protein